MSVILVFKCVWRAVFVHVVGGCSWFWGGHALFTGGPSNASGDLRPVTGDPTSFTGERVTDIKTRTVKRPTTLK